MRRPAERACAELRKADNSSLLACLCHSKDKRARTGRPVRRRVVRSAANMHTWNPGDRVAHATFGTGAVIEQGHDYVIVHFDSYGRKKMALRYAVLAASSGAARVPEQRRAGSSSERPTDVGYENLNEQVMQRRSGATGTSAAGAVYVLKCKRCDAEYGVRAADILLRRCPGCMDASAGLPIEP